MTLKNLKLALLAVMSVMWAGCDKETSLDDTYADILLYVSETTVWETIGSGGTPAVEYMQVKAVSRGSTMYTDMRTSWRCARQYLPIHRLMPQIPLTLCLRL